MSLQLIEGGAGTGKTTTLIERLSQRLAMSPLAEHQKVLALTKMHGSRRRMRDRLAGLSPLGGRFESTTVDSFAWRIICRWRSLARAVTRAELPAEFEARCVVAGQLLQVSIVQDWVATSFPIVLIDELQDSKKGQLHLIQGLISRCDCIAAGDSFQDLGNDTSCASVEWARMQCTPTVLSTPHRTNKSGLIAAATALRNAQPVASSGGFKIMSVPASGLGAWQLAVTLVGWRNKGNASVLSPTQARNSAFVRAVVERVNDPKPFGKQWWQPGSLNLYWEQAEEEEVDAISRSIGLPLDEKTIVRLDELVFTEAPPIRRVREWFEKQRSLHGKRQFTVSEVRTAIKATTQQAHRFARGAEQHLAAMTVHQAKNREFDRVVLLWPYEVRADDEGRRRLAYNAITRARHEVVVIVQGSGRELESPFVPGVFAAPRAKRAKSATKSPRAKNSAK